MPDDVENSWVSHTAKRTIEVIQKEMDDFKSHYEETTGLAWDSDSKPEVKEDEAVKYDEGKPRWDLIPVVALSAVVDVLTFGANKYGDRNWEKGTNYSRIYRALFGHVMSWWSGETMDKETGSHHLAHAACCCLFLIEYHYRAKGKDNRP